MAANDVMVGPDWQDMDVLRSPKIQDFAKKVSYQGHPEFGTKQTVLVEVTAGGKTFKAERSYSKERGPWGDLRMTEQEILDKFRHNASRLLTADKIDRAVSTAMELEKVGNVSELMEQVTL
jgi:2-methylcitrate dehydratase PrpD